MIQLKTYRGHIRNWEALCTELSIDKTLSRDAREKEILIRGYEMWGNALPDHLYGMFAFALYDTDSDRLICVRDHFGTKSFYYYQTSDGRLLYGTMIRDIISQEGFVKELNEKGIYFIYTFHMPLFYGPILNVGCSSAFRLRCPNIYYRTQTKRVNKA